MQDLLCKVCNQSYNTVDRIPKIIKASKQTACSTCISSNFDFTSGIGVCPISKKQYK